MICYANKSMIPALKEIWKDCFHDPEEYIDLFFREFFQENKVIVYVYENQPVSMATLIPASLTIGGRQKRVYYVYAVATAIKFQGKGFSSKLLGYIHAELEYETFLQPATDSLMDFYRKNGYHPIFTRTFYLVNSEKRSDESVSVSEVPIQTQCNYQIITENEASLYKKIRDKAFQGEGYISFPERVISYAIKENAFTGGDTLLVNHKYIVMYRIEEDTLMIRETTMPTEILLELESVLFNKLSYKTLKIAQGRQDSNKQSDKKIISQELFATFELKEKNGYFNLAFE